jgi:hypothetical protein
MSESRQLARMFLNGVGDPSLGEWEETGERGVFHVRRRLSTAEQEQFGIPVVRDVRGTPEYEERLLGLLRDAPYLRTVFA